MPVGPLAPYRKTLVAVVGAIIAFATLVITSDPSSITSAEWLSGAIGLATALGVYGIANIPAGNGDGGEDGAVTLGEIVLVLEAIFFVVAILWFIDNAGWLWAG